MSHTVNLRKMFRLLWQSPVSIFMILTIFSPAYKSSWCYLLYEKFPKHVQISNWLPKCFPYITCAPRINCHTQVLSSMTALCRGNLFPLHSGQVTHGLFGLYLYQAWSWLPSHMLCHSTDPTLEVILPNSFLLNICFYSLIGCQTCDSGVNLSTVLNPDTLDHFTSHITWPSVRKVLEHNSR